MRFLKKTGSLFRTIFRRRRLEQDLNDELRGYIEELTERKIQAGLDPQAARRQALIEAGGMDQLRERVREQRSGFALDSFFKDVVYAGRGFRRTPGFVFVVVLMLALGIGANAAIFGVIDAAFLREIPVKNPDEIVFFGWASKTWSPLAIRGSMTWETNSISSAAFSYRAFQVFRSSAATLSDVFAFSRVDGSLFQYILVNGVRTQEVVSTQFVSGNYFQALGVPMIAGRALIESDDAPGAEPAVVISYRFWKRRFANYASAIGAQVLYSPRTPPATIVGVTAEEFQGLGGIGNNPDVTLPLSLRGSQEGGLPYNDPNLWSLYVMARTKPGVTFGQVRANLEGVFQGVAKEASSDPSSTDLPRLEVASGSRGDPTGFNFGKRSDPEIIAILSLVSGLLLIIVCLNVANLLLARAATRGYEIGVRLAMGASRLRLIRQLLTESVLIAAFGGAAGVVVAYWGKNLFRTFLGEDIDLVHIDIHLLLFTMSISLLTGVFFGIAPAFRATRANVHSVVKKAAPYPGARSRLGKSLLLAQVAMSLLLVITGGVFFRTLQDLMARDPGFYDDNLIEWRIPEVLTERAQAALEQRRAMQEVIAVPGVTGATAWSNKFTRSTLGASVLNVGPNFFEVLGIPIVNGRTFGAGEQRSVTRLAIINETLARRLFRNTDPIGKQIPFFEPPPGHRVEIKIGSPKDATPDFDASGLTVIGIAKNSGVGLPGHRFGAGTATPSMIYVSEPEDPLERPTVEIRTASDAATLVGAVRAAVGQITPNLSHDSIQTYRANRERESATEFATERALAAALNGFGFVALLLVSAGLYGITSFSVARRTTEIGIRMALGARRSNVAWLVQRETLGVVLGGSILGAIAAAPAMILIRRQVYGLAPHDPLTMAFGILLVTAVASFAAWLPARRASRVDPMIALRIE